MSIPTRRAAADPATASARAVPSIDLQALFPEPSLDPRVQDYIGDRLRAMYADLLRQPLPEHLVDLIGRLDERDGEVRR